MPPVAAIAQGIGPGRAPEPYATSPETAQPYGAAAPIDQVMSGPGIPQAPIDLIVRRSPHNFNAALFEYLRAYVR